MTVTVTATWIYMTTSFYQGVSYPLLLYPHSRIPLLHRHCRGVFILTWNSKNNMLRSYTSILLHHCCGQLFILAKKCQNILLLTISNSDNESYTTWRARVCESDSPPLKRLRHDEIKADLTFAPTFDSEDDNDDGSDELEGENNTTSGLFDLELARKKFLFALMEPQHPDSENEVNLFDHERRCFDLALAFLKETKGGDYKFVLLVTMCPLTTSKGWGTHTYFFAHLKGTNSSPELFFADVVLAPVNSVHCCKVDPSSFSLGKAPLQFEVISHCPHVKCFECVDHCNYEFESDIEVSR
ncbi:uncharacterized protein LOC110737777 isoform X2 [Chenopodium quinoa]|uniref:uncharacterized protein LOC110737777 isoform X2 n=1 Tax=Chenopodium quinoa TaxID=63459 RepID=UPI000B77F49C|nr:uncharacterized protein LOC110737777 isoform X2 [Chenopodium quinoa]